MALLVGTVDVVETYEVVVGATTLPEPELKGRALATAELELALDGKLEDAELDELPKFGALGSRE